MQIQGTVFCFLICCLTGHLAFGDSQAVNPTFKLAMENRDVHVYSTLFTAQDVDKHLTSDAGIARAVSWCQGQGITRVFLETYRSRKEPSRETLVRARDAFTAGEIKVSGCITPTIIGTASEKGSKYDSCYSSKHTQKEMARIFAFTADLFDEVMIDDFLFTKCQCERCVTSKGDRSWAEFRTDLMVQVSKENIIAPAKAARPDVKVIIKYPNWYDGLQDPGYDIERQTKLYDRVWTGTETRGPYNMAWGGLSQYAGFFMMQWVNSIAGMKNDGGWFDEIDTTPEVYVEQARQTILGQAKESMLFHYGSLIKGDGAVNAKALHAELPELFKLARLVKDKSIAGVIAPKPANSPHDGDLRIFDYPGMLGIPVVPTAEIPTRAKSIFLAYQALHDPELVGMMQKLIERNTPMVVTSNLAKAVKGQVDLSAGCVEILEVPQKKQDLYDLDQTRLDTLRKHLLTPLGLSLDGPSFVAIYPIGDNLLVVENFNDEAVTVKVGIESSKNGENVLTIPADAEITVTGKNGIFEIDLPGRTLVVIEYQT